MNTKFQKSHLLGAAALIAAWVTGTAFSGTATTITKDQGVSTEECFVIMNTLVKRHC